MSQYAYNKHNTTWKVLCTVFTIMYAESALYGIYDNVRS